MFPETNLLSIFRPDFVWYESEKRIGYGDRTALAMYIVFRWMYIIDIVVVLLVYCIIRNKHT